MVSGVVPIFPNQSSGLPKQSKAVSYQIADSAAPIRNAAGNIVGVMLMFSDVKEKDQAEQILQLTRFTV